MMISKKRLLIFLFLVFICSASKQLYANTLKLKLMWILNDQYAGEIIALTKGWYKEAGVNVKLLPYKSNTPDPYTAVINGGADVGISETLELLRRSIKDGSDIVIFGLKDQISPAGFMALSINNISAPGDLGKKTFGFYDDGNIEILRWYSEKHNIDYSSIKVRRLLPDDMRPLTEGKVDFIIAHETNEPIILKLNGYRTVFFPLSGPEGLHFGPAFFCRRSYYEKNKKQLIKFIEATIRGWRFALRHPEEVADVILRSFPQDHFINGSKDITRKKFVKSLDIKRHYMTYKVGMDCIGCMTKNYWELVRERLISDGVIADDTNILDYVEFDASRRLIRTSKDKI